MELLIVGLLLFQMTMPVTLTAVARLMPRYPATAFGATCLALILGALPTFFPFGAWMTTRPLLVGQVVLSAVCLVLGLRFSGVGLRLASWRARLAAT